VDEIEHHRAMSCSTLRLLGTIDDGGDTDVWVPESRRTSRDLLILVDEAVASVASSDLVELGSTAVGEWA